MVLQLEERRALSNGVQTEQRRKHVIYFSTLFCLVAKKDTREVLEQKSEARINLLNTFNYLSEAWTECWWNAPT